MSWLFEKTKKTHKNAFDSAPEKWEWIVYCAITAVFFFLYFYGDSATVTTNGINLADAIARGDYLKFYEENTGAFVSMWAGPGVAPNYYITQYLLFAVWCIPLAIIERVFGIFAIYSVPCVLWAKAVTLPFIIWAVLSLGKICGTLGLKKNAQRWCQFIFLSSTVFVASAVIIGQSDIIAIAFMLEGLNAYLKKDHKKFVMWFAFAVCFKMFALMLFVPLLLLKEKNIPKIIVNGALTLVPLMLFQLPFSLMGGSVMANVSETRDDHLFKIFHNVFPLSSGAVAVFVVAVIVFWVLVYIMPTPDGEEFSTWSLYLSLAAFALFFLTSDTNPYWNLMLMPFLAMVTVHSDRQIKINMLLETVMSAAWVGAQALQYEWCYSNTSLVYSLMRPIFGEPATMDIGPLSFLKNFLLPYKLDGLLLLLNSVWFAALLLILCLNFPKVKLASRLEENEVLPRGLVWTRISISWVFCLIPIGIYIWSL
ncbi:MAG: hypothetical protein RR998_09475 [Oscillospiraceae bacterium]